MESTNNDYEPTKPRISVEITQAERKRLNKCIPWGMQRRLFSVLIDAVCAAVEEHGELALAAILMRRVNVLDLLPLKEKK